jgi:hypothetical protein
LPSGSSPRRSRQCDCGSGKSRLANGFFLELHFTFLLAFLFFSMGAVNSKRKNGARRYATRRSCRNQHIPPWTPLRSQGPPHTGVSETCRQGCPILCPGRERGGGGEDAAILGNLHQKGGCGTPEWTHDKLLPTKACCWTPCAAFSELARPCFTGTPIHLIGLDFSSQQRQIVAFEVETTQ